MFLPAMSWRQPAALILPPGTKARRYAWPLARNEMSTTSLVALNVTLSASTLATCTRTVTARAFCRHVMRGSTVSSAASTAFGAAATPSASTSSMPASLFAARSSTALARASASTFARARISSAAALRASASATAFRLAASAASLRRAMSSFDCDDSASFDTHRECSLGRCTVRAAPVPAPAPAASASSPASASFFDSASSPFAPAAAAALALALAAAASPAASWLLSTAGGSLGAAGGGLTGSVTTSVLADLSNLAAPRRSSTS
mmetsp:Transcript_27088/g.76077  ORF Transcript_27088/g.76077 Transcript_27088/m.76077 type:complete len:265 (+) Transcript_27088:720-1514(+)